MGRLGSIAAALLGVLVAVVVLYTRPALSDGDAARPQVERFDGRTSDGGTMTLWRDGDYYWWRVDSAPDHPECEPETKRPFMGWTGTTRWLALAPDGSFEHRDSFKWAGVIKGEDGIAAFEMTGRFRNRRASGTFERRDTVYRDSRYTHQCVRRVRWFAR